MKQIRRCVLEILVLTASASAAQAHAQLERTVPPAGTTAVSSPNEIRLEFNESIEPRLSKIVLTNAAGKMISTGQAVLDPKDSAELVVPVTQQLGAGVYTVEWQVVSADTHKTSGTFIFTLKP